MNLSGRHANYSHGAKQRRLLPHVFAVFGLVCGGNSNENENSTKSGISQDLTEVTNISKNSFLEILAFLLLEFQHARMRVWSS